MSWYEEPAPPPLGWHPDPGGQGQRWWDGRRWTAAATVVALIAAIVAALHLADPAGDTEVPPLVDVSAGWGAWVALVAALTLASASAALTVRSRTRHHRQG